MEKLYAVSYNDLCESIEERNGIKFIVNWKVYDALTSEPVDQPKQIVLQDDGSMVTRTQEIRNYIRKHVEVKSRIRNIYISK